jgi:hypothetical protein
MPAARHDGLGAGPGSVLAIDAKFGGDPDDGCGPPVF